MVPYPLQQINFTTFVLFNGIVKAGYRPTVSRTNVWHNGTEGLNQYMAGSDTGGVTVLF